MSKLSIKLEYEKKAKELRDLIEIEAKKLQKTIEAKDSSILDIEKIKEKKQKILEVIVGLDKEIKEKQEHLNQLMEKENNFLASIKQETNKEKLILEETKDNLEKINADLEPLIKLSLEMHRLIKREGEIKIQYLSHKESLINSEKEYKDIKDKLQSEREYLDNKNKELDFYKEYVKAIYGKLASYVNVAKGTIEDINKVIQETGTPIQFDLPPGEIIKIDFNNFDKKRIDS